MGAEAMNPPTLKELVAQATPGKWTVEFRSHSAGTFGGTRYCASFTSIPNQGNKIIFASYRPTASEIPFSGNDTANAQLIARLSPDVALAVYEALEDARDDPTISVAVCDRVKAALRLLDGMEDAK